MTDEEEFAARSQLKWAREDDAWILLYRRRRMGCVVPDKDHPGMWRSVKVDFKQCSGSMRRRGGKGRAARPATCHDRMRLPAHKLTERNRRNGF